MPQVDWYIVTDNSKPIALFQEIEGKETSWKDQFFSTDMFCTLSSSQDQEGAKLVISARFNVIYVCNIYLQFDKVTSLSLMRHSSKIYSDRVPECHTIS